MRRKVLMNWQASSYFGWGVYGLNLALALAHDPDVELVSTQPLDRERLAVDAVRMRSLDRFFAESAKLQAQLKDLPGPAATAQTPMLAAVNSSFGVVPSGDLALSGAPTIALTFFETAVLPSEAVARAKLYPLIITGSTWNERVLRAHGVQQVRTVLQGVDPLLFHAAPRPERLHDRFFVFSGGKLELRKGQDIALAAFRKFAARRPDAVLVAAWHSPWPALARTLDLTGVAAPVALSERGELDAAAWARANGISPEQFIDAGQTPNALMPQLFRQMDVGLFPNRCEGGTNLVAMECMACGTPAILSANSGHLDLIEEDNCYVLSRQGEVREAPQAAGFGEVPGWGESDVDEAVELLERAYADRQDARRRGERGAATLARLPWSRTAAELVASVQELCAQA